MAELQLVVTKLVLFILIDEYTNSSLICGDDLTIQRLRGGNNRIYLIGSALPGMKEGIVSDLSRLDLELFKDVPCV